MRRATYRDRSRRAPKRLVLPLIACIILAAALAGGVVFMRSEKPAAVSKATRAAQVKAAAPTEDTVESHMLFVGDVFWGRTVQTKAERSGLGYAYPTKDLTKADRQTYDAWIANFECPITTNDVPLNLQISDLKFNCRPEYLANLAKWFTAASQANNHTDNNGGKAGLDATRQNLAGSGIQNFGTYDMDQTNDICEVISMPAHTVPGNTTVKIPVAMCGFMYVVDTAPTETQLNVMKEYAKVMPVIAFPHMGVEYRSTAEEAKVSAYHRMIDAGADAVIGAHPHVIQNSEVYKGRLIAYSTGNFLFDQQSLGRATTLGLGVGLDLTIKDPKAVQAYESVGPSCAAYKDTCLQQLETKLTARPAIGVTYNFTCFDEAGGVPATGSQAACAQAEQAATIDKLDGLSTSW